MKFKVFHFFSLIFSSHTVQIVDSSRFEKLKNIFLDIETQMTKNNLGDEHRTHSKKERLFIQKNTVLQNSMEK